MNRITPYAKAIIAALIPAFQLWQAAATDDVITGNEWTKIGIAALGALMVLLVPAKGYRAPGDEATTSEGVPSPRR